MRRSVVLAATGIVLAAAPALAQSIESAGGSWSVVGFEQSCLAINRSPSEFNFSPYNAIGLHQFKGEDLPRLQAFFWPGAFEPGAEVTISVTPNGKPTVELAAKAESPFHATTIDMAPEDVLEALTNVPDVQIAASGVAESLLFETGALEQVADLMGKCVGQ
jgi:hypothetical protein